MLIRKECTGLVAVEILLSISGVFIWIWSESQLPLGIAFGMLVLFAVTLYFFRDPKRKIPEQENIVISPADGKVLQIRRHHEETFCSASVTTVSIFLRLWDMHVNLMPVSGTVLFTKHIRGTFYPAMTKKAKIYNEQMRIGLFNKHGRFLIRQVAGILVQRIVCNVQEGDTVLQGQRFGMIKFGSLVELSIPSCYQLCIQENQVIKAGETILGILE